MSHNSHTKYASWFFAVVIFFFGLNHFFIPDIIANEVPAFFPAPKIWVYLVGLLLIVCALAFFLNVKVAWAGYALGIMIIAIALLVHFNGILHAGSLDAQKLAAILFAKDMAIAAGAFYIASNNEE